MPADTLRKETQQDKIIERLVQSLSHSDFRRVRAHGQGSYPPDNIYGSRPDVTAWKDREYIFDVETDLSIRASHCVVKWRDFGAYARHQDAEFYVVVPKASELAARIRLSVLGIEAKVLAL